MKLILVLLFLIPVLVPSARAEELPSEAMDRLAGPSPGSTSIRAHLVDRAHEAVRLARTYRAEAQRLLARLPRSERERSEAFAAYKLNVRETIPIRYFRPALAAAMFPNGWALKLEPKAAFCHAYEAFLPYAVLNAAADQFAVSLRGLWLFQEIDLFDPSANQFAKALRRLEASTREAMTAADAAIQSLERDFGPVP